MAVMGMRLAQRVNGVSLLHGQVSREMFAGLWPGFDTREVPIGSVTNGVHTPTWVAPEILFLTGTSPGEASGWDWERAAAAPAGELWEARHLLRARLVACRAELLAVLAGEYVRAAAALIALQDSMWCTSCTSMPPSPGIVIHSLRSSVARVSR